MKALEKVPILSFGRKVEDSNNITVIQTRTETNVLDVRSSNLSLSLPKRSCLLHVAVDPTDP